MTVSVTLTFPNYEAALLSLAKLNAPLPAPQPAEPKAEAPAPTTPCPAPAAEIPVSVEPPKRRGRQPKKDDVTADAAPAPAPAEPIKKEQALAKFQELHATKGISVCRSVLARCGAERFAMVKSEQYPEFIKLCDRALAGEDLTLASE